MTEPQSEAWADLVQNLALWSTLPVAMLDSIQRAEGAYEAGNAPWVNSQLANFDNHYQLDLNYAEAVRADAKTLGLAVPEPSTWAMMLLGLAVLGFAGRRTRGQFRPAD